MPIPCVCCPHVPHRIEADGYVDMEAADASEPQACCVRNVPVGCTVGVVPNSLHWFLC